jgi:predicted transposase YbfD/YdcC
VFPEAQQFLRSRNITTLKKATSCAAAARPARGLASAKTEPDLTRYFVTSHSEKVAHSAIAQQIRSHWCCESRHWQRDALWREDSCLLRNANSACALALLRTALQTLLRRVGQTSLAVAFEDVAHDLSLGLGWLMTRQLRG